MYTAVNYITAWTLDMDMANNVNQTTAKANRSHEPLMLDALVRILSTRHPKPSTEPKLRLTWVSRGFFFLGWSSSARAASSSPHFEAPPARDFPLPRLPFLLVFPFVPFPRLPMLAQVSGSASDSLSRLGLVTVTASSPSTTNSKKGFHIDLMAVWFYLHDVEMPVRYLRHQ